MEIKQITDFNYASTWDNFIISNSSPAAFLQSWKWGEFKTQGAINNKQGKNVLRYAIYNKKELIAVAQFIKTKLPLSKFYLNCPKGPVLKSQVSESQVSEIFRLLENKIRELAEKENIVFFRVAPPYEKSYQLPVTRYQLPKILVNLKEPEQTLILNLSHSEEDLLKEMHSKTRYNIRLAKRKGIKIRQGNENDIDEFYRLMQETAMRDKINIFGKEYYKKLVSNFGPLLVAEFEGTPLSMILMMGFGNTATYFFGASGADHRELMPNHLIQWHAIHWVKEQGYKYYDFWGVSDKKKDWKGITRFKRGFVSEKTGREIFHIGTFDFVLDKIWYNLYRLAKLFRV